MYRKKIQRLDVFFHAGQIHFVDWKHVNGYRPDRIKKTDEFVIEGKEITYIIEGVYTHEQAKAIAILYHSAKTNGKLKRYRLD